jgi:hypothetical protein
VAKSRPRLQEGVKSTLLLLFLIGVVAYFAFTSIPSAQRPTLKIPSPTPTVQHSGQPGRP